MKIGIIDADLIGRQKHRFPNLACMKLSSYHKRNGADVSLVTDYSTVGEYDKIILSKVFTDTQIPYGILDMPNIEYGGTGFFYDKAPALSYEVEHSMPDYHLYDEWVREKIRSGSNAKEFAYYTDYSIGFLTRGCFRKCSFCVNQNYSECVQHSHVSEFLDESRPKICFLDDNFFACPSWKNIIEDVKATGKRFQFKQGLDERLLTDEKIHEIRSWKYDGDMIFAFDNIEDKWVIEEKLKRIFELYPYWGRHIKFYVFCGYDREDVWDDEFWKNDLISVFDRIFILSKYSAKPYIMRFEKAYHSRYSGIYSSIASWCNQPSIFKTFTYEMFCKCKGMGSAYSIYKRDVEKYLADGGKKGATWRSYDALLNLLPGLCEKYAHILPKDTAEYGEDRIF